MPRPGPAYPISPEWRRDVRAAIDAIRTDAGKKISDAEFARRAGISKAALNEALLPTSKQTTIMPHIHKALGWDPPTLVLSPDKLELLKQWDAMGDFERGETLQRARESAAKVRARGDVGGRRGSERTAKSR